MTKYAHFVKSVEDDQLNKETVTNLDRDIGCTTKLCDDLSLICEMQSKTVVVPPPGIEFLTTWMYQAVQETSLTVLHWTRSYRSNRGSFSRVGKSHWMKSEGEQDCGGVKHCQHMVGLCHNKPSFAASLQPRAQPSLTCHQNEVLCLFA